MKRFTIAAVLIGALTVPGLATGLPKPPAQETTQEFLLEQLTIDSKSTVGRTTSNVLAANRVYRFEVTGYWKPNNQSGHFVDAGFKTTDSWTNKTKGIDKGLLIGNVNLGAANQQPTQFNSGHLYSVVLAGRGVTETIRVLDDSYGDNENVQPVVVKIFEQRWVTYTVPIVDINTVIPLVVNQTVPVILSTSTPAVPGATVDSVDPPGTGTIGGLRLWRNGQGLICLSITAAGRPEDHLGCVNDLGIVPPQTVDMGADPAPVTVCNPPCEVFPGVGSIPITIGGQQINEDHSFPAVLNVSLYWEADRTKLFNTPVNDAILNDGTPSGSNQLVLPFSNANSTWAQEELMGGLSNPDNCHPAPAPACSTELTVALTVIVDGNAVAQKTVKVPLVGQILEAMFLTKISGI